MEDIHSTNTGPHPPSHPVLNGAKSESEYSDPYGRVQMGTKTKYAHLHVPTYSILIVDNTYTNKSIESCST